MFKCISKINQGISLQPCSWPKFRNFPIFQGSPKIVCPNSTQSNLIAHAHPNTHWRTRNTWACNPSREWNFPVFEEPEWFAAFVPISVLASTRTRNTYFVFGTYLYSHHGQNEPTWLEKKFFISHPFRTPSYPYTHLLSKYHRARHFVSWSKKIGGKTRKIFWNNNENGIKRHYPNNTKRRHSNDANDTIQKMQSLQHNPIQTKKSKGTYPIWYKRCHAIQIIPTMPSKRHHLNDAIQWQCMQWYKGRCSSWAIQTTPSKQPKQRLPNDAIDVLVQRLFRQLNTRQSVPLPLISAGRTTFYSPDTRRSLATPLSTPPLHPGSSFKKINENKTVPLPKETNTGDIISYHNWCDLLFLQNKEGYTRALPTMNVPISLKTYHNVLNDTILITATERPISNHVRHLSIGPLSNGSRPMWRKQQPISMKVGQIRRRKQVPAASVVDHGQSLYRAADGTRFSTCIPSHPCLRVKVDNAVRGIAFDFYKFPKSSWTGWTSCLWASAVTKDQQPKLIHGTMQHAFLFYDSIWESETHKDMRESVKTRTSWSDGTELCWHWKKRLVWTAHTQNSGTSIKRIYIYMYKEQLTWFSKRPLCDTQQIFRLSNMIRPLHKRSPVWKRTKDWQMKLGANGSI